MNRIGVKELLESYYNEVPIYPSDFPIHLDEVIMFDFTGNVNRQENLSETQLIVYSRANTKGRAEQIALDMRQQLLNVTNKYVGNAHILRLSPLGKHADYGGNDENGREYFIIRYRMIVDEKEQSNI